MQEKVIPVAAGLHPTTVPKRLKLEFGYDAQHRRVMKRVKEWAGDVVTGGFTNVVKDRRYVYDSWNMIVESSRGTEARWTDGAAGCPAGVRARAARPNQLDHTTATGNGLEGSTLVRTQVWGQDLSGTKQGAGGVGGLLAVRHGAQTYVPLMDGNGNVMGLQGLGGAKDGQTVARYDYDAFGNRITNTAPELGEDVNPFGFSTKFTDEETGLVYYGYRYYAPESGRWVSRDPVAEIGGLNLFGIVGNNLLNRVDYLGLSDPVGNWITREYALRWNLLLLGRLFNDHEVKRYSDTTNGTMARITKDKWIDYIFKKAREEIDKNNVSSSWKRFKLEPVFVGQSWHANNEGFLSAGQWLANSMGVKIQDSSSFELRCVGNRTYEIKNRRVFILWADRIDSNANWNEPLYKAIPEFLNWFPETLSGAAFDVEIRYNAYIRSTYRFQH